MRNIEIIPEIDLPGHSRAIAHVRPEILCAYRPDTGPSGGYDERGFSDQSHFSKFFKEVIGLTPGQYRNIFRVKQ